MAVRVIESLDKALLGAFKIGLELDLRAGRQVEQGKSGRTHWLIVEDNVDEDNATFRLTRRGLRFVMAGVEI